MAIKTKLHRFFSKKLPSLVAQVKIEFCESFAFSFVVIVSMPRLLAGIFSQTLLQAEGPPVFAGFGVEAWYLKDGTIDRRARLHIADMPDGATEELLYRAFELAGENGLPTEGPPNPPVTASGTHARNATLLPPPATTTARRPDESFDGALEGWLWKRVADGGPSPHPQHCWVKLSTCPPESRTNEYKSLYTCSDRCPAVALSKMRKYLSEFISACLNMDMNGSITFGVMESGEYDILAVREGLDRAKLGDLPAITCGFA